jgi:hypothetical protein
LYYSIRKRVRFIPQEQEHIPPTLQTFRRQLVPFAKLAIVMPHSGHGGQQDPKYNCKYPHRRPCDDRQLTILSVTSDSFYNFSEHDQFGHSQDPSGPTLMNHEQQLYLDNFFDHPDQATTNNMDNDVVPYSFAGVEINDRSGMTALNLQASQMGFGLGIGSNSAVHMPVPGASTPRYTSHMAPPQLSQYDASRGFENFVHVNEHTPSSQTQSHITHDDQAASALMSMSSHSQEHSQATVASGVAGSSWGDFNMGDANGIAGEQLHSPMVPNASSSGSNTTPLTPTFGDNFPNSGRGPSHAQFHQQSLMQQATSYAPARHQSMQMGRAGTHMFDGHSQLTAWQTYQAQMDPDQSQRRPPIVQYGSDQNFNNGGYRAAIVPTSDDKYTNLLNIPLVSEVSQNTHTPFPTAQQASVRGYDQQRHHSFPSSLQQLSSAALTLQQSPLQTNSPTYQQHNDQFSAARAMENLQGSQPAQPTQPSRKRRRSQDDDQDAGPHSQTQQPTNAPRRAPVVPKQEPSNDNGLYPTPTTSAPKRRRSDPRPKTASSTASGSPSTPAKSHAKTASSSKKRAAEPKQQRANLSDMQKRNNHIASEQKRRDAMKTNYEDLNRLVPTLQNGQHGMSRSEILQNSADYLESVRIGNETAAATYGLDIDAIRRAAILSVGATE